MASLFFLTQVYGLPSDRIYATYFEGDEKSGIQPDNEARDIWLKFLPSGRVLPFGCKVCSLHYSSHNCSAELRTSLSFQFSNT